MSASNAKKKTRLVRDRFAMPKDEHAVIDQLKTRAVAMGTHAKKSELIRAGLMVLAQLNEAAFKRALAALPRLGQGAAPSEPLAPNPAPVARQRQPRGRSTPASAAPVGKAAKPGTRRAQPKVPAKKPKPSGAAAKA
jgi:hypothetical protein